jgi:hypothetical protein
VYWHLRGICCHHHEGKNMSTYLPENMVSQARGPIFVVTHVRNPNLKKLWWVSTFIAFHNIKAHGGVGWRYSSTYLNSWQHQEAIGQHHATATSPVQEHMWYPETGNLSWSQSHLDALENRKTSCTCRELNHNSCHPAGSQDTIPNALSQLPNLWWDHGKVLWQGW